MQTSDLNHRFAYHPPKGDSVKLAHEDIRASCRELAGIIDERCPDGREKSAAMTKLEETMFWANAAIARG